MVHHTIPCCRKDNVKINHLCSKRIFYLLLVCIRIFSNFLPQTGYIHPDEFFQSIEIASGDVFDIDVNKPWEFNVTFPVRCALFPHILVKIPYQILEGLSPQFEYYFGFSLKTPFCLLLFPRFFMTILSFISDYCLYKICVIFQESYIDKLIIFASSYVTLVYSTRTFSNSIELVLTSLLLYHVSRCIEFSNKVVLQSDYLHEKYYRAKNGVERTKIYKLRMTLPSHTLKDCLIITTIAIFGIFNRPTFVAFAFPPIFFWLFRGLGSKTIGFLDFHARIIILILLGIPSLIGLILYDSLYFGYLTMGEVGKLDISIDNFVVTPLNFLKYNTLTDNLKNHGLHPRFLHFIINVPLLFSVIGIIGLMTIGRMIYCGLNGRWLELPRVQTIESLMIASFSIPIALLSIFPHQEPRFIIPVLLPLVYLFSHLIETYFYDVNVTVRRSGEIETIDVKNKTVPETKSWLRTVWYTSNIILMLFYGFLHQGGIIPLSSHLFKELKAKPDLTHIHLISSHIYSLPTGFLFLRNTKKTYTSNLGYKYKLTKDFHMTELGSVDAQSAHEKIFKTLKKSEHNFKVNKVPYRVYYALPYTFYDEFVDYVKRNDSRIFQITLVKEFYPHISTEKLPHFRIPWECLTLHYEEFQNCSTNFLKNFSDNIIKCIKQFSLILLQIESA